MPQTDFQVGGLTVSGTIPGTDIQATGGYQQTSGQPSGMSTVSWLLVIVALIIVIPRLMK